MKKPGVVLRRPVGSNRSFSEQAELPSDLGGDRRSTNAPRKSQGKIAKKPSSRPVDKRESERAREEAARQRERERRQQAVGKAQGALDKAEQEHAKRAAAMQAEVEALAKRSQTEDDRWNKERERLEAALGRARS